MPVETRKPMICVEGSAVLKEKVALVTGGRRGIGKSIAERFAQEGARIVLVDIDKEVNNVAKVMESAEAEVLPLVGDISVSKQVKEIIGKTIEHFGSIDILVNNAAVLSQASLVETTEQEWDKIMQVNLKGTFLCTRAVAPYMMQREKGKIINISSVSAILPGCGFAAYCASKAAVVQFTRVVALELAPYRICVNAIAPGTTETEMIVGVIEPQVLQDWRKKNPMGKFTRPDDHANLAVFLASPAADSITGQFISVDCGQLLNFAQGSSLNLRKE